MEEFAEHGMKQSIEHCIPDKLSIIIQDFMDIGRDAILIATAFAFIFGFLSAFHPFLLFIAYGLSLNSSIHYDAKLGFFSTLVIFGVLISANSFFSFTNAYTPSFIAFLVFACIQSLIIGYLPGKIVLTNESFKELLNGMVIIAILYASAEFLLNSVFGKIAFNPVLSLALILLISTPLSFIYANTFCPYVMVPVISRGLGKEESRYCGAKNFIYDSGKEIDVEEIDIRRVAKRGFRLVSMLPSAAVFSCPRGGVITVYKSGKILIRRVDKRSADKLYNALKEALKTMHK